MLKARAAVCLQKSLSHQPQPAPFIHRGKAKQFPMPHGEKPCLLPSPRPLPGRQGPLLFPPHPAPLVGSSEVRVGFLTGAWKPGRLWGVAGLCMGAQMFPGFPLFPSSLVPAPRATTAPSSASLRCKRSLSLI